MKTKLPDLTPILLPLLPQWSGPEDVAVYARNCLEAVGLEEWGFGWDKTTRRLGCCKPDRKRISLSVYFVLKFWEKDPRQVRRTLLHEIAHALSWEFNRTSAHDATWHRFCAKLGIADEKCCTACESFMPEGMERRRTTRYILCHKETGEVFHKYTKEPKVAMRRIKYMYIKGREKETLGKLCIIPAPEEP